MLFKQGTAGCRVRGAWGRKKLLHRVGLPPSLHWAFLPCSTSVVQNFAFRNDLSTCRPSDALLTNFASHHAPPTIVGKIRPIYLICFSTILLFYDFSSPREVVPVTSWASAKRENQGLPFKERTAVASNSTTKAQQTGFYSRKSVATETPSSWLCVGRHCISKSEILSICLRPAYAAFVRE